MGLSVISVGIGIFGSSYLLFNKTKQLQTLLDEKVGGQVIEAIGYLGGALQLGAVMAVSRGWLANTSTTYHGLSLIGSSGLLTTAFYHGAMAPTLVNVIWMGMNVLGIMENTTNTQALGLLTDKIPIQIQGNPDLA